MKTRLMNGLQITGHASYEAARRVYRLSAAMGIALVFLLLGMVGYGLYWQHVEATGAVYAKPWDVEVSRLNNGTTMLWSAKTKKLMDCNVMPGSPIILVGYDSVSLESKFPHTYKARNPDGTERLAGGIVEKGSVFVAGPWRIDDSAPELDDLLMMEVHLHCQFASGTPRVAVIGPVFLR